MQGYSAERLSTLTVLRRCSGQATRSRVRNEVNVELYQPTMPKSPGGGVVGVGVRFALVHWAQRHSIITAFT
jgi:hypothetical protein